MCRFRLTAIALALVAVPMTACSDSDEPASGERSTTTTSTVPGPTTSSTPTTVGEELGDGQHVGYITHLQELDDGSIAVGFDLAYLLTGEEAAAAATKAGVALETDYYIQNDNPHQRTVILRTRRVDGISIPHVVTTLVGQGDACCDSVEVSFAEFEQRISPTFDPSTDVRSGPLVRLTIDQGSVRRIDEVYLS